MGKAIFGPTLLLVVSHTRKDWGDEDSRHDQSSLSVACGGLEGNYRLQAPSKLSTETVGPRFFTDAKAAEGRAWIGGFLEVVEGCQGPWFSLEVTEKLGPLCLRQGRHEKGHCCTGAASDPDRSEALRP